MKGILQHILCAGVLSLAPLAASAGEVLVFAAASLKEALTEIAEDWRAETGNSAILSLAGSSTLARQIEAGAPADIFISANRDWMDLLERENLVRPGSRRDLLTNGLVVISNDPDAPEVDFAAGDGLAALLGDGRLAIALVDAVPAGIYGKAALQSLGWWGGLEPRLAQTDNVRAALALVATGEAPLGIVYATDAVAEPRVTAIGTFPPDSHPAIRYPMMIAAGSPSPLAEDLADYLTSERAAEVFRRHGFGLAGEGD